MSTIATLLLVTELLPQNTTDDFQNFTDSTVISMIEDELIRGQGSLVLEESCSQYRFVMSFIILGLLLCCGGFV